LEAVGEPVELSTDNSSLLTDLLIISLMLAICFFADVGPKLEMGQSGGLIASRSVQLSSSLPERDSKLEVLARGEKNDERCFDEDDDLGVSIDPLGLSV